MVYAQIVLIPEYYKGWISNMTDEEYLKGCIRKRKSYSFFKEWLAYLDTNPSKDDILRSVHGAIDEYKGYGYAQQSWYAHQSVEQVIIDKELVNGQLELDLR